MGLKNNKSVLTGSFLSGTLGVSAVLTGMYSVGRLSGMSLLLLVVIPAGSVHIEVNNRSNMSLNDHFTPTKF